MKLLLQNTIHGLVPLYPSDFDEKRKLKLGETYEADIKNPRNVGFHRKFFALINLGHQNSQLDMPFETFRRYVIIKAGFFNAYHTGKGTYYEAQSIAFSSMDEDTFEEVYSRVLDVIIKEIGSTSEEIEAALMEFA